MRLRSFASVLDANILAPMPVADTLLRLAEADPPFYRPLWSPDILRELRSTLLKFGYGESQAQRRTEKMREMFPEAEITGYEGLISSIDNQVDKKDRHIVAAAIRGSADCIVSDNRKHFPASALEPYGLECLSAEDFLVHQYHLNPEAFIVVIEEQALCIGREPARLIAQLSRYAPKLGDFIKA